MPAISLQPVAPLSPKWQKIPQEVYSKNQWDYTPSEHILFPVNGFPGVNMGDALRDEFIALEGCNDLVMQGSGKMAFQCRFWVRIFGVPTPPNLAS